MLTVCEQNNQGNGYLFLVSMQKKVHKAQGEKGIIRMKALASVGLMPEKGVNNKLQNSYVVFSREVIIAVGEMECPLVNIKSPPGNKERYNNVTWKRYSCKG